jgi:hypothetical protein
MTAAPEAAAKASFSCSQAYPFLATALLFAQRPAGAARQWSPNVALWMHSVVCHQDHATFIHIYSALQAFVRCAMCTVVFNASDGLHQTVAGDGIMRAYVGMQTPVTPWSFSRANPISRIAPRSRRDVWQLSTSIFTFVRLFPLAISIFPTARTACCQHAHLEGVGMGQ